MIYILLCHRIKEDNKIRNLELLNEFTLLLLSYLIFVFSDYVPNAKTRHTVGYWWIGVQMSNLLAHLIFLQANLVNNIIAWCRKKYHCCPKKRSNLLRELKKITDQYAANRPAEQGQKKDERPVDNSQLLV